LGEILEHQVEVRSTPGRGTVFSLELPKGYLPVNTASLGPRRAERAKRKAVPDCVLLIEDETSVRQAMTKVLQAYGIDVLSAATSKDALDLIRHSEPSPDLIVCDYNLRGSVNVFETIKSLRTALDRALPAIVITGETRSNVMREIAAAGVSILVKPFRSEDLLKVLSRMYGIETISVEKLAGRSSE
jgi:CheY-like chemotaxis protein